MPPDFPVTLLDDRAKYRLLLKELPTHTGPFRTLAGKDKNQFGPAIQGLASGRESGHIGFPL